MRWSTVGRAVSALVVVVLIGYLLNRGVYVGSITMLDSASGLVVYEKRCHYFHLEDRQGTRAGSAVVSAATRRRGDRIARSNVRSWHLADIG